MGTTQQLLLHSDVSAFGTLVVELLFEDGAGSGTAVNTGTLGGVYVVGGSTPASITTADAFQGSGSLTFPDILGPEGCAIDGHPTELIIGTADFRIQVAVKITTFTTGFNQVFWGWESGTPQPILIVRTSTGVLAYGDGVGGGTDTSQTVDLNVWSEYEWNRVSGVSTIKYNGGTVATFSDTSDYNNGFSSGSFRVGSFGNGAAGIRNGFLDAFRFYNGNV